MKIGIKDILSISHIQFLNKNKYTNPKNITIDSRQTITGDMFFAIKGEVDDGHNYVLNAVDRGAALIVVEKDRFKYDAKKLAVPILVVEDTVKALGELGNIIRNKYKVKCIGLSGSSGKTTTKEMIFSILSKSFTVLKTEGNLNNHLGVPLTLSRLDKKHQIALIEMGMNHYGELTNLCNIAQPEIGCLTNIGPAHIEFFGSLKNIAKAKFELFDYVIKHKGICVINNDDKYIREKAKEIKKKFTFGFKGNVDLKGEFIELDNKGRAKFSIKYKNNIGTIRLNIVGKHNIHNALAAAAVSLLAGAEFENVIEGLQGFNPVNRRMQIIEKESILIINDVYNANPDSMKAAFETFNSISGYKKRIAIIGDMLELGKLSEKYHKEVAKFAKDSLVDNLFLFGEKTSHTAEAAKELGLNVYYSNKKEEVMNKVLKAIKKNTLVLVKGSRGMKMEDFVNKINEIK